MPPRLDDVPVEVAEKVVAVLPFADRCRAVAAIPAWHRQLSKPGPLWEAAVLPHHEQPKGHIQPVLPDFLSLQQWLRRKGPGLRQLWLAHPLLVDEADGGLITAVLSTLTTTASSLQALRIDGHAGSLLLSSTLMCIAAFGHSLRQLALFDLQSISHAAAATMIQSLPHLQDLALTVGTFREGLPGPAPDMIDLLRHAATSCCGLHTLALSGPSYSVNTVVLTEQPLPQELLRLTAMTSLALHRGTLSSVPADLSAIAQLQQLSLELHCRGSPEGGDWPLTHELSALTNLHTLQISGLPWPRHLPTSLTKLVVASPQSISAAESHERPSMIECLLTLTQLRHLALHHVSWRLSQPSSSHTALLPAVCAAAAALPYLRSLHLVSCSLEKLPPEVSGLSRLQLLDLRGNEKLLHRGAAGLTTADLAGLAACQRLDLSLPPWGCQERSQLREAGMRSLASMPKLQELALPLAFKAGDSKSWTDDMIAKEQAMLADCRSGDTPPIGIVATIPASHQWGAVHIDVPFEDVSQLLGRQLRREACMCSTYKGWMLI